MRRTFKIALLFFLFAHTLSAQRKFSVKFQNANARSARSEEIQLFSVSVKDGEQFLQHYGDLVTIQTSYRPAGIFHILTTREWLFNTLSTDDNILFIDVVAMPSTESINASANAAVNRINMLRRFFPELKGTGRKVSIKEKNFDPGDIDLINRTFVTSVSPSEISQHATAMATFIAGGGNSSETAKGAAYNATVTASDFANLLPDPETIFVNNNIHVQNHSYGVSIENYYGNEATAYDEQSYALPDVLHIFSAGNLGSENPTHGKYQGMNYANLSGNFKQSKNVLLVTAADETLSINTNNSRGPAFDGRLKPELAAHGAGGTSDAAALASGIASLLQEKYIEIKGQQAPSSAVKAALIASADDIGPKGIDYQSGYGSINAFKAVQLINHEWIEMLEIGSHEEATISISVPSGIQELKVAVAWTDPPSIPNASTPLIHDIDSYISREQVKYFPWKLKTSANLDSLAAPAFRGADHLNNVEYITIVNPSVGTYDIVITSPELTTVNQSVAVAYWLEEHIFSWSFPLNTDVLEAGESETVFWNSHNEGEGSLWWQLNGGEWMPLDSDISLDQAHFLWNTPDTLSLARLKMEIDNADYISEDFLISPRPKVTVPFNCQDDFALSWNTIAGAAGYEIFSLADQYMVQQGQTEDTLVIRSKEPTDQYFSVAPKFGTRTGLRNITIDFQNQGASCYLNLFAAQRYDVESILVELKLSTLINLQKVVIYRMTGESKEVIYDGLPVDPEVQSYDYKLISSGTMKYQAEVVLSTGTHILSDVVEVYVPEREHVILFPNPLVSGVDLTVLSDGTGQLLRIVDATGKVISETELEFMEESLTLDGLNPGLYFFQLLNNKAVVDTGKFVKL
jgi:hypothetical protein